MMMNRRHLLTTGLSTLALAGCGLSGVAAVSGGIHYAPLTLRPAEARGHASRGWLEARHSFSFGKYRDPNHMGFRALRVINEDRIAAGGGFPRHPHRDMEIITYVLDGALEHKDSLGNGGIIQPGLVQQMSAGRGVYHSEFNPSAEHATHMLQIWLHPDKQGHRPQYQQQQFSNRDRTDQLRLIVSGDPKDSVVTIHQDARIFASVLRAGRTVQHDVLPGRHTWIQVARGQLEINGAAVNAGDGLFGSEPGRIELKARQDAEFLIFDLS